MEKKRACRICGTEATHPAWTARAGRTGTGESFTYFQCTSCGCLQIEEVPVNLGDYYKCGYYSFGKVSDRKLTDPPVKSLLRKASARVSSGPFGAVVQRLLSVPDHHVWFRTAGVKRSSRILDVGCGSGPLLLRAWKEGYRNSSGIDPFIDADIRYSNGLVIRKAGMEDLEEAGSYDFIMMNHSFEHMTDQASALKEARRLLRAGGTALIRVPVASSYAWEHYRTDWVQLAAPEHLYLHTEKSIAILAEKTGFEVYRVIYDSSEFQFYGSELLKKGVPISEHKEALKGFGKEEMQRWKAMAKALNREKKGDMACFFLRKTPAEIPSIPSRPF